MITNTDLLPQRYHFLLGMVKKIMSICPIWNFTLYVTQSLHFFENHPLTFLFKTVWKIKMHNPWKKHYTYQLKYEVNRSKQQKWLSGFFLKYYHYFWFLKFTYWNIEGEISNWTNWHNFGRKIMSIWYIFQIQLLSAIYKDKKTISTFISNKVLKW
jgi:hypothetical protein